MKFLSVVFGSSCLLLVFLTIYGILSAISFDVGCEGYLKRAADANTVAIAKQEMQTAMEYIEANDLTEGSSHWLYRSPSADITFWHKNLSAALQELEAFPTDADAMTTSNQLMKLRETLLDEGEDGSHVTHPPNISIFPNQFAFNVLLLLGLAGFVVPLCAFPIIDTM